MGNNCGDLYIIGLGDYKEGELVLYDDDQKPTHKIDIRNKCYSFDGSKIWHSTNAWTGGNRYSLVFFRNAKGKKTITPIGTKLNISSRLETTDEKVIDEIFKSKVYEKPSRKFLIESTDRWLDCGANIGCFSLYVLNKGCQYVVSYEPEATNFKLLHENLKKNFDEDKFLCLQKAVGVKNEELPLYLCKGNYNKYRHSFYRKKGRSVVHVPIISILNVLQQHNVDCIKMDIEGSEIDILEQVDIQQCFTNVKKLVFEYTFDRDKNTRNTQRFLKIIKIARS